MALCSFGVWLIDGTSTSQSSTRCVFSQRSSKTSAQGQPILLHNNVFQIESIRCSPGQNAFCSVVPQYQHQMEPWPTTTSTTEFLGLLNLWRAQALCCVSCKRLASNAQLSVGRSANSHADTKANTSNEPHRSYWPDTNQEPQHPKGKLGTIQANHLHQG